MDDLSAIRTRLWRELRGDTSDPTEARRLVSDLVGDGTWPDIDYTDRDGMAFRPLEHVARALRLAQWGEHRAAALNALDAWRRLHHGTERRPRSESTTLRMTGAYASTHSSSSLLNGPGLPTRQRSAGAVGRAAN